jgi:hypothetical protein
MADRSSLEEGFQPTNETQGLLHHQTGPWKGWKSHFVKIAIILIIFAGIIFVFVGIASIFDSNGKL